MENYVYLSFIHDLYHGSYEFDWEVLISIYHWLMFGNNFVVVNGDTRSEFFTYNKNAKGETIIHYQHRGTDLIVSSTLKSDGVDFWMQFAANSGFYDLFSVNVHHHVKGKDKADNLQGLIELVNYKIAAMLAYRPPAQQDSD